MEWLGIIVILFGILFGYGWLIQQRKERELSFLASEGFNPCYTFDNGLFGISLAIDIENEGVAILWPNKKRIPTLLDFSEIIGVEVCRNGGSIHRTNRGSQILGGAVGGVLFGRAGMIIGGLSGSSRSEETTNRLSLIIYTSDMDSPSAEVEFFKSSSGVTPGSFGIRSREQLLNDWYGRIQSIMKESEKRNCNNKSKTENNNISLSKFEDNRERAIIRTKYS